MTHNPKISKGFAILSTQKIYALTIQTKLG